MLPRDKVEERRNELVQLDRLTLTEESLEWPCGLQDNIAHMWDEGVA